MGKFLSSSHDTDRLPDVYRPVIGSFLVNRKGWRWTQWTMLLFAMCTIITTFIARETFHPVIKFRRSKELGLSFHRAPLSTKLRGFVTVSLLRPVQMVLTEPIVALICLYVACEFATLFSFFAAFPLVFQGIYGFGIEASGLVFLSIVVGCLLGAMTVLLCDIFIYRRKAASYQGRRVPPEHRLYPSLIGSIGLPISLFWFGWTSRADVSWASPVTAIALFGWGNICVFVSTAQYIVDTYHGSIVASAMSANSLARYGFAAAFPLFTVQSEYFLSPLCMTISTDFQRSVYEAWDCVGLERTRVYRCPAVAYSLGFHHRW